MQLAPVILIGQSIGGVIALLTAAQRPDLVRALVLADASPDGGDGAEEAAREVGEALSNWPVPFVSQADALGFFTERFGAPLAAEAWSKGLERRSDGWWPRFDVDVMVSMLHKVTSTPCWDEWTQLECPVLAVRAGRGTIETPTAEAMLSARPDARMVELPDAAHDLHLDQPREWRATLSGFLDTLDGVENRAGGAF